MPRTKELTLKELKDKVVMESAEIVDRHEDGLCFSNHVIAWIRKSVELGEHINEDELIGAVRFEAYQRKESLMNVLFKAKYK